MKDMKYIVKDNVTVNHTCLHCKKKMSNIILLPTYSTAKANTAESCYYVFEVIFSDLLIVHRTTYMLTLNLSISLF